MRKVCRKGRPAPAQTAGSHQSEKTELFVWHLPHTQPFPWLPFSVRKLETPSGGEDLLITGALRKLRSLLLPEEQNTDYLQNELAPNKEPLCRSHCILTCLHFLVSNTFKSSFQVYLEALPLLSVPLPEPVGKHLAF